MRKAEILLSIVAITTAQDYDSLSDITLQDLSAILAAYDVTEYSSDDYQTVSEYEEVGPSNIEFGDYPTGFDNTYFNDDSDTEDELIVPDDYDLNDETSFDAELTNERRPDKFNFDFDYYAGSARPSSGNSGRPNDAEVAGRLAQAGQGTHTGTSFNFCRVCTGQSATDCANSNVQEECNAVQPVCQVTVRIARKNAEPLYWSECKEKKSCYNNEQENFVSSIPRFHQCKSTDTAARFAHGSTCTFCAKLGTATNQLIFRDTTNADNPLKILTSDGTTEINVADALKTPQDFFLKGGSNYIYDSQTWYTDTMGNP